MKTEEPLLENYKSRLKEVLKHTGKLTEFDLEYCFKLTIAFKPIDYHTSKTNNLK